MVDTPDKMKTRVRKVLIAAALMSVVAAFAHGCATPAVLKKVLLPRSGRAVHGKIAVVYSSGYQIKAGRLKMKPPFDIRKYERIYRALVDRNMFEPGDVFVPDELSRKQLLLVHTDAYLESLKDPRAVARYLEAPSAWALPAKVLESRVVRPFRLASGGTLLAARLALEVGIGINIGGGYHHAMPARGEGFCIFADVPIAIRQLQRERKIRRALIIDLDVHQGNGTIACLRNDSAVYTFSMHEGGIYPIPKQMGDEDIELRAGMGDEDYLAVLSDRLRGVFERAGNPDMVFYVAGCDTLADDPRAHLTMTPAGIAKRDRMVIDACKERGIPVVMTLSGGYSDDAWKAQYLSIRGIIASRR